MKYHTLSTSSLAAESKKSTLTIYTGPDFVRDKMGTTETAIVRCELEMAQRALKLQTRRCRQLVSEFTRKLQAKELEFISERRLRDEQLTKVLRSLLVFEARLKQEQTFIRYQLEEKDNLIQRQKKELRRLQLTVQYCKTCSQYYSGSTVDSCDSSSEYFIGSQENWEESGSELYASVSEYGRQENSSSNEEIQKQGVNEEKITYEKNKYNKINDGSYKRKKPNGHRRMTGTYFEVLKLRESSAESSLEDASSEMNDSQKTHEQIDEVSERIEELFSESPQVSDTYSGRMDCLHGIKKITSSADVHSSDEQTVSSLSENTECDTTVVYNMQTTTAAGNVDILSPVTRLNYEAKEDVEINPVSDNVTNEEKELSQVVDGNISKSRLISDTITMFDAGETEQTDNWYASASDPEDDERRDIYRNNPVLECMNQILLQNINDSINSPPKSPELDRNPKNKTQKRVKFSDEEVPAADSLPLNSLRTIEPTETGNNYKKEDKEASLHGDYYETPIQGGTNFYEVPQSIYSNDYEQILSKCSDSVHSWSPKITSPTSKIENIQENKINRMATQKLTLAKCNDLDDMELKNNHYYIDMDTRASTPVLKHEVIKRTKVARTPPALPPKPANLVSKFKIQSTLHGRSCENIDEFCVDSEPDYCSISELNLPTEKMIMSKMHPISPVVEINTMNKSNVSFYDPISLDGTISSLVALNVEKNSLQEPKQPQIKSERIIANIANIAQINMLKSKNEPEIPKLPQVSEIIIPEETDEKETIEHISQDNYIKNNSQLLKQNPGLTNDKLRNRIVIGTSVSSLVSSFNNQHLLSQLSGRKIGSDRFKNNSRLFSNFEYTQDYEKQPTTPQKAKTETHNFEKFDLSQNFEEFNLDDCEIGEEYQSEDSNSLNYNVNIDDDKPVQTEQNVEERTIYDQQQQHTLLDIENRNLPEVARSNTSVEIVRATKDIRPHSMHSLQQLQKSLSNQRNNIVRENELVHVPALARHPEPSYEHFLECTGLSSKSILTPSRMLSNHKSMLKPKDIKLRSRSQVRPPEYRYLELREQGRQYVLRKAFQTETESVVVGCRYLLAEPGSAFVFK
ncbi:hypothetical protein CBL_04632 [Carabus blaptoides fortunei]